MLSHYIKKCELIVWVAVWFMFFQMPVQPIHAAVAEGPSPPEINAEAWIIVDSRSGETYAGENEDQRYFPASITKIVTAMLAIEKRDPNEVITVSQTAADTIGTSLNLKAGDQVILEDMLYGIMLHSGNDGAVAIAEHISGSESDFAKRMTNYVYNLGARNTNFTNASGLPDENHYTTAKDMALIALHAMKSSTFREIVATKSYDWKTKLWTKVLAGHEEIETKQYNISWDKSPRIVNHNRFLLEYKGAIGIKNGFTHESRYTLVEAAKRGDTELIAVVLKSDNADTAYKDIKLLMDYGFSLVKEKRSQEEVTVSIEPKASYDLPNKVLPTIKSEPANPPMQQENKQKVKDKPDLRYLWLTLGTLVIGAIVLFMLRKMHKKS